MKWQQIGILMFIIAGALDGCTIQYTDPEVVTKAAKEIEACKLAPGSVPEVMNFGTALDVVCTFPSKGHAQ